MSGLIQYIQSLEDRSFTSVREHFTSRHCRVLEADDRYMICAPNDSSLLKNESAEFRQAACNAVGTILRKDDHTLLCYGFPKTEEVKVEDNLSFDQPEYNASEYIDGTLLRAYHDGVKWCVSTSGMLDAYQSYWISSKSFGELLDECLGRIYKNKSPFCDSTLAKGLDKDCTYQFILSHPSVHLDQTKKPCLYHVGAFNNKGFNAVEHTVDPRIRTPQKHVFCSFREMAERLTDQTTVPVECAGYIFYVEEKRYKLLHPSYLYIRSLLGNTPNLYLRYIEAKAEGKDNELLTQFPALRYYSSWVDRSMGMIAKTAYGAYVNKFILKDKTTAIDFYYRPIVYELHGEFIKTSQKVNYQSAYALIWRYHPKRINFLLNGLKMIDTGDVLVMNASNQLENNEPLV